MKKKFNYLFVNEENTAAQRAQFVQLVQLIYFKLTSNKKKLFFLFRLELKTCMYIG